MAEFERYLDKVEKERDLTVKKDFWVEYQAAISELRRKASRNCEVHEDVRIYQGEIQAYDRILKLPDKLIDMARERKRAKNR